MNWNDKVIKWNGEGSAYWGVEKLIRGLTMIFLSLVVTSLATCYCINSHAWPHREFYTKIICLKKKY